MCKKGENIYKRQDGRWEARILINYSHGKPRYKYVYDKNYNTAKNKSREARKMLDTMHNINTQEQTTSFEILCHKWLDIKEIAVKASSFASYKKLVDDHIIPNLGQFKLKNITQDVITDFCLNDNRFDNAGKLSPKTQHEIIRILSAILIFGKIPYDITYPKQVQKEARVLTPKEQLALEKALQKHLLSPPALGIYICLYTGLRVGELCGLRWCDVNLKSGTISVKRTIQRIANQPCKDNDKPKQPLPKTKLIISSPKSTNSKRDIVLPSFLLPILALAFINSGNNQSNYILSSTEKFYEPRQIQRIFQKYVALAGLENVNFHALRHTFATRYMSVNRDIKTLSAVLGHSTVKPALDIYIHTNKQLMRKNINNLKPLAPLFKPSFSPSESRI